MSTHSADDRFARHRLIEGFSQDLVSGLRLAVVGAGAIGNELIKNLLLMGVGAIDVYDFDTVERSNLTRSVFLRESDLGQNKAQALVSRAQELHPATRLGAISGDISRTLALSEFAAYDMVVAAVDNIEARLRINEMALIMQRSWMNLAIDARSTVVEIFPAHAAERACYACSLPSSVFERMAARFSCGGLQRASWLERKIPTTAITASAVAALACSEMLRFVHQQRHQGTGSAPPLFGGYPFDRAQRVYMDTVTPSISRTTIRKAGAERGCPGCALHRPAKSLTTLTRPDNGQASSGTISPLTLLGQIEGAINRISLLEASKDDTLVVRLSDALILNCYCAQCGANSEDTVELSALRGARAREQKDSIASCPKCQEVAVVFDISETQTLAEFRAHFDIDPPDCAWLTINDHCIDLAAKPVPSKDFTGKDFTGASTMTNRNQYECNRP
jgi:molybdopterin/thiamine biosynthesis adenylyltransferase